MPLPPWPVLYICMDVEVGKLWAQSINPAALRLTKISGSTSSSEQIAIIPVQLALFFSSPTRLSSPGTMGFSSKLVAGDSLRSQNGGMEILKPERQKTTVPLRCPRCESTNTKFCYYNNYNKSQPRHFCRACRRYWTDGGTLRNVPIGGGRKNKRLKTGHNNTPTSMDNSGIAQHQRQHQQMPLPPFDDGDGHSSIFPGILHQMLLRPPPPPPLPLAYTIDGSSLFPLPPFLSEFGTAGADLASTSDNVINTMSSISSFSCSSPYNCTRLDSVVGEDGLAAWKAPTSLPASYLSCREDMSDLVNAQDSILSTYP